MRKDTLLRYVEFYKISFKILRCKLSIPYMEHRSFHKIAVRFVD